MAFSSYFSDSLPPEMFKSKRPLELMSRRDSLSNMLIPNIWTGFRLPGVASGDFVSYKETYWYGFGGE